MLPEINVLDRRFLSNSDENFICKRDIYIDVSEAVSLMQTLITSLLQTLVSTLTGFRATTSSLDCLRL